MPGYPLFTLCRKFLKFFFHFVLETNRIIYFLILFIIFLIKQNVFGYFAFKLS